MALGCIYICDNNDRQYAPKISQNHPLNTPGSLNDDPWDLLHFFQFFLIELQTMIYYQMRKVNICTCMYRLFFNYCSFSLKCCDFSDLCQFCWSAGVLPAIKWSKHEVYTPRKNRERPESGIYFKIFEKNTIFNEHPVVAANRIVYKQ